MDVSDQLAIYQVVAAYGFLLDDRDWDSLERVFTHDAVVDFSARGLPRMHGIEEIRHQNSTVLQHPLAHILTNTLIQPVSDDVANVRCKGLFAIEDGKINRAEYRITLMKSAGGWRITLLEVPGL